MRKQGLKNLFDNVVSHTIDALESTQSTGQESKIEKFIAKEINGDADNQYLVESFARTHRIDRNISLRIVPEIVPGDLTIKHYHLMYNRTSIMYARTLTELCTDIRDATLVSDPTVVASIGEAMKQGR